MIYTDVTENKICLTDICGAALIKPAHKQNQGKKKKKKRSLCNGAHSKHQAWFSRAARDGKPPSGVSYPVNLALTSLNLNRVRMHRYLQEPGDIALLICISSCPTLLRGNYVKLCFVIFSSACIHDLELMRIKAPEEAKFKMYFVFS